jgi:hypothetical protein
MGLNEGINVFVGEDGVISEPVYVRAYARRYPFMLAKLSTEHSELSLCFDPTTDLVGEFADGQPLFENDNPTDACKATLSFCEQFEIAGQDQAATQCRRRFRHQPRRFSRLRIDDPHGDRDRTRADRCQTIDGAGHCAGRAVRVDNHTSPRRRWRLRAHHHAAEARSGPHRCRSAHICGQRRRGALALFLRQAGKQPDQAG